MCIGHMSARSRCEHKQCLQWTNCVPVCHRKQCYPWLHLCYSLSDFGYFLHPGSLRCNRTGNLTSTSPCCLSAHPCLSVWAWFHRCICLHRFVCPSFCSARHANEISHDQWRKHLSGWSRYAAAIGQSVTGSDRRHDADRQWGRLLKAACYF